MAIAIGQQLDNIGEIVGETRQGRDDAEYLIALQARIKLNTSSGTIEDVIGVMALVAPLFTVVTTELFPASFSIEVSTAIVEESDIDRLAIFTKSAKPTGVGGQIQYHVAGAFQYDGPAGSGYDLGKYGNARKL